MSLARMDNVRQKPWLIELLPWIDRDTCTAIYPYVFLSRSVYASVTSASPDPYAVLRVIHEKEHIKRAKERGPLRWYVSFFFFKRFRFEEEIEACRPQLSYLKSLGLTFNFQKKAQNLSGWLYFWAVPNKEAIDRLLKVWDTV